MCITAEVEVNELNMPYGTLNEFELTAGKNEAS